jgi:hypothetical protein
MGFAFVASGPLVRSSYHAAEGFVEARLRPPTERAGSSLAANGNTATESVILPLSDTPQPALIRPESLVRR